MSSPSGRLTKSLEDYLEAIAVLHERDGKATVTTLSEAAGVKKPSVDWAVRKLSDAGLVTHERYGDIHLTDEGAHLADEVCRRHKALLSFLTGILMVDTETAEVDACRMEHALSRESMHRLESYISFVMKCYPGRSDWEDIFNRYLQYGVDQRGILPDLDSGASPDGEGRE